MSPTHVTLKLSYSDCILILRMLLLALYWSIWIAGSTINLRQSDTKPITDPGLPSWSDAFSSSHSWSLISMSFGFTLIPQRERGREEQPSKFFLRRLLSSECPLCWTIDFNRKCSTFHLPPTWTWYSFPRSLPIKSATGIYEVVMVQRIPRFGGLCWRMVTATKGLSNCNGRLSHVMR